MKTYQVVVPKPVQKQLNGLPYQLRDRILKRLIALEEDARPHGFVKLKGYENEFRIRIGNYRVRYEIIEKDSVILILHCKHRRDIYRK